MKAERAANDEAVRKTNVRIGTYTGWKPRDQNNKGSKPNLPKYSNNSLKVTMNLTSDCANTPSTKVDSSSVPTSVMAKDNPHIIWNESTD